MRIIEIVRGLFKRSPAVSAGEMPTTPTGISRRTFFSFLGTTGLMLAKPGLFIPKGPLLLKPGLKKEFAETYERNLMILEERIFFQLVCGGLSPDLLPAVSEGPDGALFHTSDEFSKIRWGATS